MAQKTLPFMSIVVICYNGEATVKRTLDSLLALDYPRKRFEIIIVDDASTDGTGKIVRSYKKAVKYVRLTKNQGVSGARNAGLKVAKGEIYVSCDDDCIVEQDWLTQLANGYKLADAIGVGGYLAEIEEEKKPSILRQYIGAQGSGFPPAVSKEVKSERKPSPFKRLWGYLAAGARRHEDPKEAHIEVAELYGANATFRIEILKEVGGWSAEMSGIEDRDISSRIHKRFPNGRFYAMRKAVIMHDPAMSVKTFLLRPYRRGPVNLRFHQTNGITPPIFPFPVVFFAAFLFAAFLNYQFLPLVILVLPQVLYFWWSSFPSGEQRVVYFTFPYIQLAEETMVMTGLVRGYVTGIKNKYFIAVRNLFRISTILALIVTSAWAYASLRGAHGAIWASVSAIFLALVPGYFAFRAIVGYRPAESKMKITSYALGLSLIVLMLTGLAVNQMIPILTHNQQPFSVKDLTVAIGTVVVLLVLIATQRAHVKKKRRSMRVIVKSVLKALPVTSVSIVLPILAVGGAITINNGGSNWLALTVFGLIGLFFIVLVWKNSGVVKQYPIALYGMCLAILLGTSMRGWNITGHDVMQEYQVFQLTLQHAAWHMEYYQDAYNACLSITILPTIFQKLTGIPDPYIYKFLYQVFFAMIVPTIYITLRDYVPKKTAFLAAFLFMTFPTFLTDITMLNRQAVALFCLALSLQVGLDKKISGRMKQLLIFILLTGVVISHYSTSYITVGVLFVTLVLGVLYDIGAKRFKKRVVSVKTSTITERRTAKSLIYTPTIIILTCLVLYAWGTPITHTSGNIAQTITGLVDSIPTFLHKTTRPTPKGTVLDQYLGWVMRTRVLPASDYYPAAIVAASPVANVPDAVTPETSLLKKLHIPESALASVYDLTRTAYAGLTEGLIGVGLLLMLFKLVRTKLPRQYVLLGVASLIIIGVQVVAPSGVINYGILRVIQQSLILLSLPIVLACFWLLGKLRINVNWQSRITAVGLLAFFLVLSGFIPTLTGGYKPVLALSNSGFYYEAYYTHQDEISADQWLVTNALPGSRVYADEFARRKMVTYTDSTIFAQPVLVADGIPVDSYVYLSNANTTFGDVPLYYNGDLASHTVPYTFLNTNKNVLYSSGQVVIYK